MNKNAAIAYELNSSESNALYLWKNDAEGEIYIYTKTGRTKQIIVNNAPRCETALQSQFLISKGDAARSQ